MDYDLIVVKTLERVYKNYYYIIRGEKEIMPVGSPKPQTVATEKYAKKAGWISKSYKLKKEVVDEYTQACKRAGVSAAGQLTTMMKKFTEEVNGQNPKNLGLFK